MVSSQLQSSTNTRRRAKAIEQSLRTIIRGNDDVVRLAMIAVLIGWESIGRLLRPVSIAFDQAILVAVLGLCVNVTSAWLLRDEQDGAVHSHVQHDSPDGAASELAHKHHHDLNLRAAYVHVLADAAVSILAITGLVAGRQLGWVWMDPLMGIVGACVIANWSWGLVRAAAAVLLDLDADAALKMEISKRLEQSGDRIADLHVWRIGPGHVAAIVSLVSDQPEPLPVYRERLADLHGLSHVTIELQWCPGNH